MEKTVKVIGIFTFVFGLAKLDTVNFSLENNLIPYSLIFISLISFIILFSMKKKDD